MSSFRDRKVVIGAAVVLLLFSVLVYPTVAGNQSPPTGGRPVTS